MMCLLASPDQRIGSRSNGSMEFENGLVQIIAHPWFANFDWEGLHLREGPYLPRGARDFPHVFNALASCPKTDPNFNRLISVATQNFDTFEDNVEEQFANVRQRVNMNPLDLFYDYNYRRVRKPRIPVPSDA